MKKILVIAGLGAALAIGSVSANAASSSDVAIGLLAGGIIGAALGSSTTAYAAPAPAYAAPAPVYATPSYYAYPSANYVVTPAYDDDDWHEWHHRHEHHEYEEHEWREYRAW